MEGQVDTTFTTEQRDLFASGLVAEIGVNAYAVWHAIKFFADFKTGESFPGMRAVGDKLGISAQTVLRAIRALEAARLVRVVKPHSKRRGQTYIARERLAVRLGSRLVCTIVLDYVPNTLRQRLAAIEQALEGPGSDPGVFSDVEIIPGPGFAWDRSSGVLRGQVAARDLPPDSFAASDEYHEQLGRQLMLKSGPNMVRKAVRK